MRDMEDNDEVHRAKTAINYFLRDRLTYLMSNKKDPFQVVLLFVFCLVLPTNRIAFSVQQRVSSSVKVDAYAILSAEVLPRENMPITHGSQIHRWCSS